MSRERAEGNESIEHWRRRLAAAGVGREAIDELESHLLDAADRMARDEGLADEAALAEAIRRLGSAEAIGAEFRKVERLLAGDRCVLGAGVLLPVVALVLLLPFALAPSAVARHGTLLAFHVGTTTFAYVGVFSLALIGAYTAARRLFTDRSSRLWSETVLRAFRSATAIGGTALAAGLATGAVWSQQHHGTAWTWDPKEIGGASVLLWYLAAGACSVRDTQPGSTALLAAVAIAGSPICFLAWFGAAGFVGGSAACASASAALALVAALAAVLRLRPPRLDRASA